MEDDMTKKSEEILIIDADLSAVGNLVGRLKALKYGLPRVQSNAEWSGVPKSAQSKSSAARSWTAHDQERDMARDVTRRIYLKQRRRSAPIQASELTARYDGA